MAIVSPHDVTAWWSQLARFLEPDVIDTEYLTSNGFTLEASIVAAPFLPAQMVEAMRGRGGAGAR